MKKQLLNQLVNIFWTVLAFAPVMAFWLAIGMNIYFYLLIIPSICLLFLPNHVYKRFQLSDRPEYYQRLGLKFFRRYTQDGDIIKQILRSDNSYKVRRTKKEFVNYLKTIQVYERYHMVCFAFFLFTGCYAIVLANFAIFILITMANILYNVIPLLLQQYNRLRIKRLLTD
ncbi:MAG TPA: hypothetical protein PKJ63_01340 [Cyclobacteriaceae bacterium]|nr:hypothetical protein [Cyclobacteriaceae bacterium]